MKHYFITGVGGFIGRHLIPALRATGIKITVLLRGTPQAVPEGVTIIQGAIEDVALYQDALATVTHIIHMAGDARFGNGAHYDQANRAATQILVQTAKAHAPVLQRFVFLSTFGAVDRAADDDCTQPVTEQTVPHPTTDYGRSKLAAEQVVRESGIPFVILRPALVVGADMRANSHCAVFARMAVRRHLISWFAWTGKFSVIAVDDVVSAILHSAENTRALNQTYMLAGEAISLDAIFAAAHPRWRIPLYGTPWIARRLRRLLPFNLKSLLLPVLVADDTALRATGWSPRLSALQALAPVITKAQQQADMKTKPAGRTVVTGAAGGLGRALAEQLVNLNRDLLLVDRDQVGLADSCAHANKVERVLCDLSDEADRGKLIESVAWRAKPISELFLIAGMGVHGEFASTDLARQQKIFAVNVAARMHLAHTAIASMKKQGYGRIVIISSSSAFQPLPTMSVYAASNAALLSWGEALGVELAASNIDVLTVCPGGMQTRFQDSAGVRKLEGEKLQTPEEVAMLIIGALAKGTHTLFTVFRVTAMSWLARGLPRSINLKLWYHLMKKMR